VSDGQADGVCRWGVIGAGRIAKEFVAQLPSSRSGILIAVASSGLARARGLAAANENVAAYGDYAPLLVDPDVESAELTADGQLTVGGHLGDIGVEDRAARDHGEETRP
jgi:hypothetical protein